MSQPVPSTAAIPLYVFPLGATSYKIGINVSLNSGAAQPTYLMYEFDTGGTGFWAAYNPTWWTNAPGSITASNTYTSGIVYQANIASEPITFEGTVDGTPTPLTVNSGGVAAIVNASNQTGSNPFTNAQWQQDISLQPPTAPLFGNFFGDFGMGLGTTSGLFAILPQLPGNLSTGFIVDIGPYPTSNATIGTNNYVQVGSVQVGLTAQDIAAFPYDISMQRQNTGTPYPNSNQPTYQEVLANGTVAFSNASTSTSVPTGLVFDSGAPSTAIHAGSIVSATVLDPFLIGGTVGNDVVQGTSFALSSPGTTVPLPQGGVTADWLLSFLAGTIAGVDRISTTTADVIGDTNGYVNTGLQPFFDGRVMFDLRDGIIGFSPYTWQGTVALPAGFNSNYTEVLTAATTITAPGSAHVGGQLSGTGALTIATGTVDLAAANTNTGGVFIGSNATLELGNNTAGGTGPINMGGPGATLLIDPGVAPTETIGSLQQGDFIDTLGINGGTVAVAGNQLTIANSSTSLTLSLDASYPANRFRASADGSGGTMISYVSPSQPYVVPIYHGTGTSLIIYASLNGGPLDPYLLDSGSPNMFSVYGSWWPGYTTPVSQPGTASFSFANGTTYYYNAVPTSVGLGSGSGGTVVAAASNVNVAQITNIGTATPAEDFASWASAVAAGNAPISTDNTYGNFSAGLYGSNSLATVLAQIPIGATLKNGFIIDSGGSAATTGSLTIGLDPALIAQWESNPATIVLPMQPVTGTTLPNPDGNTGTVSAYQKAQIGNSVVTLTQNGTATPYAIPTVIDTGGGPNNIIYNPGGTPDLSGFLQPGSNVLQNGITFDLSGTTTTGSQSSILDYVTGPTGLPSGGNTDAIGSLGIPGTLRVNPGISLFYQYNVMFDLTDGEVLLQPISCFAAGTRIAVPSGEVEVEALAVGDLVRTASGKSRAITWIGHRTLDCKRHATPASVQPVRIRAGAFGPGRPKRDLLLSPDHAVFFGGVLIPVKYLINGSTVRQTAVRVMTYFHLELDRHDVVLANGLPAESYLDTGNRTAFANGGDALQLHAHFGPTTNDASLRWEAEGCAPLVVSGTPVEQARRLLMRRAEMLLGTGAPARRRRTARA